MVSKINAQSFAGDPGAARPLGLFGWLSQLFVRPRRAEPLYQVPAWLLRDIGVDPDAASPRHRDYPG